MGLTRIELSGTVVKPPMLGATPNGKAVLRLTVDCGEEPGHLVLDVVMVDESARDLARQVQAGQQIRAAGTLKAIGRGGPVNASRRQIEVIACEIAPGQLAGESDLEAGSLRKLI